MEALRLFDECYETDSSEQNLIDYNDFNIDKIPLNFVISRNSNNEIISIFNDDTWNLKPYRSNPSQRAIIDYKKRVDEESYIQECKKLIMLLLLFGSGRNGSRYSVETIQHFFDDAILLLFNFSFNNKITIKNLLEDNNLLREFIRTKCSHRGKIQAVSSLLIFLNNIDNNISKINFNKDIKLFGEIHKLINKFNLEVTQTKIIPSRILRESIKIRWEQIKDIEKNIDSIINFLNMFLQDEQFAVSDKTFKEHFSKMNNQAISWAEAIETYGLSELFEKYKIKNRRMFQGFVTSIYGTAKHLIHMYTGMRNGEVLMLRNQCIKAENTKSGVCHIISTTSKLEGRNKLSKWTTTKELISVIELLGKINKTIAFHYNIDINEMPLFIKGSFVTSSKRVINTSELEKRKFGLKDEFSIPDNILLITPSDVKEFEEINYGSQNTQIKAGEKWIFKTHQYRRSLAAYAIQSGLVSLGALQIQFKHLFREMTLYYGNGASYAKKLFDIPNNHIANDFDKLKPEIETLEYIKNVIFSDEQLFGTHGTFIERNVKNKNTSQKDYILENREKTLQQFKKGELAYKETALGGCISTGACDYALTRSIVACGGCDSSIIKKSKLDNVINKQKEFIEFLDKDSIEYRTEMRDLEELEKQRKQFLGSKA